MQDPVARLHSLLAEIRDLVEQITKDPVISTVVPRTNKKKLTKQDVSTIRDLKRAGHPNADIADIFDVNPSTISRIVRGIYWK